MLFSAKKIKYLYARLSARFDRPITVTVAGAEAAAAIAAAVCLICLIIYVGYDLQADEALILQGVVKGCQLTFAAGILLHFVFRIREMARTDRLFKWVMDVAVLLTLIPVTAARPESVWLSWIYSRELIYSVLAVYSVFDICYSLSQLVNRRTNPSLLMGGSFLFFIIAGAFALMLPKCTVSGISFFDALFVSSSAVCITGLTSVDLPTTFTPLGIGVISVLVQLGSLGIITFTSFFALFFTGSTSIYNQLLLKDMVFSKSMNALIPTLLYVLGFTLVVELTGAVAVYFTIPPELGMTWEQKLIFSAFHSMSSFCNAGFSILPMGMGNPALMQSSQWIYAVTSVLIFAGAIGFPILVNFKEILAHKLTRVWDAVRGRQKRSRRVHIFDVNTKLVLYTTIAVLTVSTMAFFILEYDNTLSGMSLWKKTVQSVFNSLTPRSAGFASVSPAAFLDVTLLLVLVQMVIGGSSQSMAGGIKVNTFGTVLLCLRSVIYGKKGTTAFRRTLSDVSVRRAFAVLTLGLLALLFYSVTIMLLEPGLPTKALIFESVSALFTVGSSLGVTEQLCPASKVLLCTAMFVGRVGIVSLLCGFFGSRPDATDHYPEDNVIIN